MTEAAHRRAVRAFDKIVEAGLNLKFRDWFRAQYRESTLAEETAALRGWIAGMQYGRERKPRRRKDGRIHG